MNYILKLISIFNLTNLSGPYTSLKWALSYMPEPHYFTDLFSQFQLYMCDLCNILFFITAACVYIYYSYKWLTRMNSWYYLHILITTGRSFAVISEVWVYLLLTFMYWCFIFYINTYIVSLMVTLALCIKNIIYYIIVLIGGSCVTAVKLLAFAELEFHLPEHYPNYDLPRYPQDFSMPDTYLSSNEGSDQGSEYGSEQGSEYGSEQGSVHDSYQGSEHGSNAPSEVFSEQGSQGGDMYGQEDRPDPGVRETCDHVHREHYTPFSNDDKDRVIDMECDVGGESVHHSDPTYGTPQGIIKHRLFPADDIEDKFDPRWPYMCQTCHAFICYECNVEGE